jgi:hypothetical protein
MTTVYQIQWVVQRMTSCGNMKGKVVILSDKYSPKLKTFNQKFDHLTCQVILYTSTYSIRSRNAKPYTILKIYSCRKSSTEVCNQKSNFVMTYTYIIRMNSYNWLTDIKNQSTNLWFTKNLLSLLLTNISQTIKQLIRQCFTLQFNQKR